MAIFKNLTTGICEIVESEEVIALMKASENYEEADEKGEKPAKPAKKEK